MEEEGKKDVTLDQTLYYLEKAFYVRGKNRNILLDNAQKEMDYYFENRKPLVEKVDKGFF